MTPDDQSLVSTLAAARRRFEGFLAEHRRSPPNRLTAQTIRELGNCLDLLRLAQYQLAESRERVAQLQRDLKVAQQRCATFLDDIGESSS